MITTLALLVVVIDDLRLRGKLYGVMKQVKTFEQERVKNLTDFIASLKAKL